MTGSRSARVLGARALFAVAIGALALNVQGTPAPRVTPKAYLNMPQRSSARPPSLLSQTGAFSDVRTLTSSPGLIPYDLVVAFWSDGAMKSRFVAIPNQKIEFSATSEWRFPPGTVFVKTFELGVDEADPAAKRRLETRLLVRAADGGVYGVVYKWRADGSDADLLPGSLLEDIQIKTRSGGTRTQRWYYPSRKDCLACHNSRAGGVLGVKTRQLNRPYEYPPGAVRNELAIWNDLQLFTPSLTGMDLSALPRLAAADDKSRSLEDRARSYLDANCAQCHRPGGTVAYFDARYETPLDRQNIVDAPVLIDEGIDHPRVVAPHDIWRSIAYMRVDTLDDIKMPPLARETIDASGVALLGAWIESLPGKPVLAPPAISPVGGVFPSAIEVTLKAGEPGSDVHYTLDGSEPGRNDPVYKDPIRLTQTSIVRARAYKNGFVHSITAQSVFTVGN
ncbi:MAG: chitobiase/beta-hexosaminidase C-terminal domain-containing protein [Steroidobacteraceae bacterium]